MDLEIIIQKEVSQRKTNVICYHLHVESEKKNILMDIIFKTEIDPQAQKQTWLLKGKVGEG